MIPDNYAAVTAAVHPPASAEHAENRGCFLSPDERAEISKTAPARGERTFDVYLNGEAYWCNVAAAVWNYRLGGYQVLKHWFYYRERNVLGRATLDDDIHYFTATVRGIARISVLAGAGFGRPTPVGS